MRESFAIVSELGHGVIEQIDGVVELDGHIYLVEMKWLKELVGVSEVSQHLVRVFNRSASRGIFISYSDYTTPAIATCKESLSKAVVVLCTLQEFVTLLESDMGLEDFLKAKIRGSIIDKQPYRARLRNELRERDVQGMWEAFSDFGRFVGATPVGEWRRRRRGLPSGLSGH